MMRQFANKRKISSNTWITLFPHFYYFALHFYYTGIIFYNIISKIPQYLSLSLYLAVTKMNYKTFQVSVNRHD